jgi:NitT/TauT family transport system substrate-binding protein
MKTLHAAARPFLLRPLLVGHRPTEKIKQMRAALIIGLILSFGPGSGLFAADAPLLKANYSGISGAFAPIWLAQEKGLFAKYGVTVDLRFIAPATATQALLAKNLDIVNPGGELIEAALSGERVVFFAGILNRIVFSMYSKPEIRAVSDLRGKVVGVTLPGSTTDFTARILLQQAGLSPLKDAKILYLKGMEPIVAALSQGNIDAGIISAPATLKARQAGFKELVNITEKNIPMIHAAFASTREFLKDHPDRGRAFLQAYLEGIKVARGDAGQAKQIIGKYTKTTNVEDLEETYRTFFPGWEKVPYVSFAAVQTLLDFATHPAARTAKPDSFIDNSLLTEIERSGFIAKLYQP